MKRVKQALCSIVGKWMSDELIVTAVREHGTRFRSFELAGEALRGVAFRAGDKAQLLLPDGPRTYTPFAFDAQRGTMQLLAYMHGESPGSEWVRELTVGTRVSVCGPSSSLPLTEVDGPVVLFGDETSLALAIALAQHRGPRTRMNAVFEVASRADAEAVLADFEYMPHTLVERREDDSHLDRVGSELRRVIAPASHLVLTGRAQSIRAVRSSFKSQPVPASSRDAVAYWSMGRATAR